MYIIKKRVVLLTVLLCTTALLPTQQATAFFIHPLFIDEISKQSGNSPTLKSKVSSSANLIYGASFIERFPNAVSALDLVRRIPGTGPILQRGKSASTRGFGSNDDGILINGKRLSGKENNSEDALGRINKDQVDYIEIIRGSSPDVKVSSQEAMINVVLKEGGNVGSGTLQANLRGASDGRVRTGGLVSYNGKSGQLEYFAEAKYSPFVSDIQQNDDSFDGDLLPLSRQEEDGAQTRSSIDFSSNLTYSLKNGDQIRLNGLFKTYYRNSQWTGDLLKPMNVGGMLSYQADGESIRYENNETPYNWEIGGDYNTNLSNSVKFKIIGLHSENKVEIFQSEDFLIEDDNIEEDFVFSMDRKSSESVGRISLDWDIGGGASLEIGDELAHNKVASLLDYQELIPGQGLVPQTISGADVTVKETRSESFANYSMKLNSKMNLDASLKYEYSKISQFGVGVDTSKTLNYFKPSVDYRYNLTNEDQFQVSYRREVSQLNFGDFASSASQDDEVVAGNINLEPEKTWKFETSFEHRFLDDAGRMKVRFVYDQISDAIQRIEVTTGISGVGNVGEASRRMYELSGNMRMSFIGIPDMVLDAKVYYTDTNVTDPFTGIDRQLNNNTKWNYNLSIRHDINDIGLSWSVSWLHEGGREFYDIDEIILEPQHKDWVDAYIEYKVATNATLSLGLENIINPNAGRVRELYDDGVAGGILTGRQVRKLNWGQRFVLSLKGTF